MKSKRQKIISLLLIFTLGFTPFLFPSQAYARISIRKFVRFIGHKTRFVVNLPYKATRFLGPTLGPIAGDLISMNLGKNPRFGSFFNKAQRINKLTGKIEEQNKLMDELKQMYRSEADTLDKQAAEIRQLRRDLAADLVHGTITREEHLAQVADLEALADSCEATADRLRRSADRINPAHIIKLLGNELISTSLGHIKNVVNDQVSDEIQRLFHPDIIKTLLSGETGWENIVSVLYGDELSELKDNPDFDWDRFRDRLLERIRESINNDADDFKNNWHEKMEALIQEQIKESQIAPTPKPTDDAESDEPQAVDEGPEPIVYDDRCKPGYIFIARSGTGCVQKDCKEGGVANGHLSYTGDCVCGSAGSMYENPDDPNKACHRGADYRSCPSCVYACVHANEDCPE